MSDVMILLTIGETIWVVALSVWIILERRSPAATLAWIFALAFVPLLGIGIYWLIGPRRLTRKRRRYKLARSRVREAAAASRAAPPHFLKPSEDASVRQLMQLVERSGEAPPLRCRSLEMFSSGDAYFASIEKAMAEARHHIHLEFYIFLPDRVGTRWRDLLCEKARDGVQVRLLVDAIGSDRLGRRFLKPLRESGAEVARFNPITLARLWPSLINFRTHRKIAVCDGRVGFTGGSNVCEWHSESLAGPGAWRDTNVRIEGVPVLWLQTVFLEDWLFATGKAPSDDAFFPAEKIAAGGPCVQIAASGPDHDLYAIHKFYFSAIAAARHRVFATTPYFVPDESIFSALVGAALRGVDVRLLVPKRGDHRLVAAAARSYYDDLARAGVAIYEYGPPMLHAKTLVVDHQVAVIGTANMDNRSFRLNFEIMAAVYDPDTANRLAALFEEDLAKATKYSLREARKAPFPVRMAESTARLFSPLL